MSAVGSSFPSNLLGGAPPTISGGLSALFGVGPRTTTQGTSFNAPPSVQAAREELIARTRGFAAEPFQPYVDAQGNTIPRVAQFSPDQQRAFEATRGLATQAGGLSALTPELVQQGIAATRGLATTLPETDLSGYMSPYTEAVLAPAIRDIEERAARERLRLGQQSARTGAFGGSRQAIAEGELERGALRSIGDLSAKERAAAYNQALEQFRLDQQRIPALYTGALANVGTGLTQTGQRLGTEVNPLTQIGGAQRALEQAELDFARQQFEEERDFPIRGIEVLRASLGLSPQVLGIGSTTTETRTEPGPDLISRIAGTALGSGLGSSVGSGLSSLGTAALSFLNPFTAATSGAGALGGSDIRQLLTSQVGTGGTV